MKLVRLNFGPRPPQGYNMHRDLTLDEASAHELVSELSAGRAYRYSGDSHDVSLKSRNGGKPLSADYIILPWAIHDITVIDLPDDLDPLP